MSSEVIAADKLKTQIARIERLEQEKQQISEDIKDLFAEAKSEGFDIPTLKHIIKLRKIDDKKLAEKEALLELYKEAMGM